MRIETLALINKGQIKPGWMAKIGEIVHPSTRTFAIRDESKKDRTIIKIDMSDSKTIFTFQSKNYGVYKQYLDFNNLLILDNE